MHTMVKKKKYIKPISMPFILSNIVCLGQQSGDGEGAAKKTYRGNSFEDGIDDDIEHE